MCVSASDLRATVWLPLLYGNKQKLHFKAKGTPAKCLGMNKYLLVLVLLQVSWGNQTLGIDVRRDLLGDDLGIRVQVLHLQKRQDVLNFQVV